MDIAGVKDARRGRITARRIRVLPLALNLPCHSCRDVVSYRVLRGEGYRLLSEPYLGRGTESDGVVRRVTDGVVEITVISCERILVRQDVGGVTVVGNGVTEAGQFSRRSAIVLTLGLIDDDDGSVIDTGRPHGRRCRVSQQRVDVGVLDEGDRTDTTVFVNRAVEARVTVVVRNSSAPTIRGRIVDRHV